MARIGVGAPCSGPAIELLISGSSSTQATLACGKCKNRLSGPEATLVSFRRPLLSLSHHKGFHHEHKQARRAGSSRSRNRGGT